MSIVHREKQAREKFASVEMQFAESKLCFNGSFAYEVGVLQSYQIDPHYCTMDHNATIKFPNQAGILRVAAIFKLSP